MSSPIFLSREYHGIVPPSSTQIPTPAELFNYCPKDYPNDYNRGLVFPSADQENFWVKHGPNINWNELLAQRLAHEDLRRLNSPVRAPAIYYACEIKVPCGPRWGIDFEQIVYVVMEYIPGKTAAQWLEDTQQPQNLDFVYSRLSLALSELLRIPVPHEHPPTAVDGGRIWHCIFEDQFAPVQYRNVQELEDHLNLFLSKSRKKSALRVQNLVLEPMVFCYSDLWLQNFIIGQDGSIAVVDFAQVSFLPSSFFKFALINQEHKLGRDLTSSITVPEAAGVDNTDALLLASAPMIMGSSSFARSGYQLLGRPPREEIERVEVPITDDQCNPLLVPHVDTPSSSPEPLPQPYVSPDFQRYLEAMEQNNKTS